MTRYSPEGKRLVQRGLSGIEAGDRTGTAHVRSSADVSFRAAERYSQIWHAVVERCGLAAVFMVRVQHGPLINVVVLQGQQFAF